MLWLVMYFLKELKKTQNHQTQNSKKYVSLMAIIGMEKNVIIIQIYWDVL